MEPGTLMAGWGELVGRVDREGDDARREEQGGDDRGDDIDRTSVRVGLTAAAERGEGELLKPAAEGKGRGELAEEEEGEGEREW